LVRKQGNRIRNEEETQGAIGEIKLGNVRSDVTVREWQVLRPPRRYVDKYYRRLNYVITLSPRSCASLTAI